MGPVISIIIPVFNGGKYIERSIKSALDQTFSDIEIIVVNDGSTDGTLNIVRSLAEKDFRIKVLDQPNGGVNAARWAGIQASIGQWICFLDADDTLPRNAIEQYLKAADSDCDIVVSGIDIDTDLQKGEYILKIQEMMVRPELWGKIFAKNLIAKNMPILDKEIVMGEDFLINLVLALNSERIRTYPKLLYDINLMNPNSVTKTFKRTFQYEIKYFSLFEDLFLSHCKVFPQYELIQERAYKSRADGFKRIVLDGNRIDIQSPHWKNFKQHFATRQSTLAPSERLLFKLDRFPSLYRFIMKVHLSYNK